MSEAEKKEKTEELAERLDEAVELAGGRRKLIETFGETVVKLSKPVQWEGSAIEEVHLDFLSLTGLDMEIIDDQIGALGLRGLLPAYSRKYQRLLAARASGLPEAFFLSLPLADYNGVTGAAANFLIVSG